MMAERKLFERQDLTWEDVAAMEPRLAELFDEARLTDGSGEHFCANRVWYGAFKPRLEQLVGWDRKSGPYDLTTSGAYSAAYDAIYAQLPGCRDCWCL